jgi:DNA recombination protein RmuC
MQPIFVISATLALILIPVAFFLYASVRNAQRKGKQLEIQLATATSQLANMNRDSEELKSIRLTNSRYLEEKSVAVTEKKSLEQKLNVVMGERDAFLKEKEEALAAKQEAQKKLELIEQKMNDTQQRMKDWETQREEALKAAKASILEAGGQMSSKLLEDHKREVESARKEAEERTKKTNETLLEQFSAVTQSVAALKDQTHNTRDKMDTVWRALSSPSGAGHLAEVGLENTLKNLRLEPGRDFVMQYAIAGTEDSGALRPDAVIFLPQDMVMVVDSKATKFSLEIAQVQGTEGEALALESLRKTMNNHLKTLMQRSYKDAIERAYKDAGRASHIKRILTIMYVPSESMLETIKRADPEFISKVESAGIILAGPASLSGLVSLAGLNIGMARQVENQDDIIAGVQELLDNVIMVLSHTESVGKSLRNANEHFDKFSRSVNSRLLPRLKNLVKLGMKPSKNKELPGKLPTYEIRPTNDMLLIEGEVDVESVEEAA